MISAEAVSVLALGWQQNRGAFGQVAAFALLPFAAGFEQADADRAQQASRADMHRGPGTIPGRVRRVANPGPK